MKEKLMKRAIMFAMTAILALSAPAEEQKAKDTTTPTYNTTRDFRNRVFEVHNRSAREVAASVHLLGSGFQGAGLDVNEQLRTITVRDFPENIAAIEEAIKRLDQPPAAEPDIELHLYVLIGSNSPGESQELPAELKDVTPQLQSTLRFKSYGLLTSAVHLTHVGGGVDGMGVVDPKLLGLASPKDQPVYSYSVIGITLRSTAGHDSINVESLRFHLNMPMSAGGYEKVGFQTPVTIREGEKVVVGTSSAGDRAIVVVVTTTIHRPAK
jgi:hypothetical protein